jgi:hypothetical protein
MRDFQFFFSFFFFLFFFFKHVTADEIACGMFFLMHHAVCSYDFKIEVSAEYDRVEFFRKCDIVIPITNSSILSFS